MTAANQPSRKCACTGPCTCPTPIDTGVVMLRSDFDRDMMLHPPKPGCASCAKDERYVPATRKIRDIPLCGACFRRWHKDEERQILKDRRRR